MTIQEIKDSIQIWNLARDSKYGFGLLTSGYGFEITREEFKKWQKIIK